MYRVALIYTPKAINTTSTNLYSAIKEPPYNRWWNTTMLYVAGSRMHCSLRVIVQTLVFSRSYLHRQVSPPETLVVKGGNTWARNGRQFWPKAATSTHTLSGSFTCRKYVTWDKRLYFPSVGRGAEDFFALKNPTASAGSEPANLGTKGQHATSRPPKPHTTIILT